MSGPFFVGSSGAGAATDGTASAARGCSLSLTSIAVAVAVAVTASGSVAAAVDEGTASIDGSTVEWRKTVVGSRNEHSKQSNYGTSEVYDYLLSSPII
jgi:hypothetical protein